MRKILQWEQANKLAIVFGIIGGLYLIYQVFSYLVSDKIKFESKIAIFDYAVPIEKNKQSYWQELNVIIPSKLNSYVLSRVIGDTLMTRINLQKTDKSILRESIENAIPKEFDQRNLVDRIDSLILAETYPVRQTIYFIKTSIKNNGDKIAKELRFELPTNGYYELSINDNISSKGDFNSNILIGELRPENTATLKIWSFKYVSDYYVTQKEIKYTFDNGVIVPTIFKSIKSKGLFYWIYKNPIWALYFLIWLPIYLTFVITKKMTIRNLEEDVSIQEKNNP